MRTSPFSFVLHVVAYSLGAFLIGWGLWCFGYELLYPAQTVREAEEANKALYIYAANMFCGVIICLGVILVSATYRHYRGGVWTFLGAVLIGLSLIFGASVVDGYLTGFGRSTGSARVEVLIILLAVVAFVFLLGCYSVVGGHVRHRRIQRESSPNTSEPA